MAKPVTPEEFGLKKPDATSLQGFTLIDGRKFKLAVMSESWPGSQFLDYFYAYMTDHPFYFTRGVYSGGRTGGGASESDIYLFSKLSEGGARRIKFVGWVEVKK